MKKIAYLFLLTLFLINLNCLKVNSANEESVFESGNIIDTEIKTAKILSWNSDKSDYIIEFNIVNNLNLSQKNIHYILELYGHSKEQGKFLVDRVIYDDIINLNPNESIKKTIEYELPTSLEKEYELQIVLLTNDEVAFNRLSLGLINQKKSQGIFIDINKCQSKYETEKNHIFKEINLTEQNYFEIQCEDIKNLNKENLTFYPKILIREKNNFGNIVENKILDSKTINSNEIENLSFIVKINNYGSLKNKGELFLTDNQGNIISNKIFFTYNFENPESINLSSSDNSVEKTTILNKLKNLFGLKKYLIYFSLIILIFIIINRIL